MRLNLGGRMHRAMDSALRRLPPAMSRMLALPVGYQLSTTSAFLYENTRMVNTAIGYCRNNGVAGDYAEFGVYQGGTMIEAWRALKVHGMNDMRLWAFDSFSGLPEVTGEDVGGPFVTGEFTCARDAFEGNLQRNGVDLKRVSVVEGFFDQTLAPEVREKVGLEKVAIAWIDCDLYESTVPVLDYLTDRLVDGAIVIFDDWYCFNGRPDKGEQRACAEWLEANPEIRLSEYHKFHWAGNSFVFHRR